MYSYLLPYYIAENLGATSTQVGILFAVTSLFAALTLLIAGSLADRYDRKKIMIAGWVAWIPAPLIFSVGQNWLQILPGMILWGVWLGGPTATAYIVTSADKSQLTLTLTSMSAAWSFGYIFSPALGGYLAGIVGMKIVFYLASLLYAVATLMLSLVRSQYAKSLDGQSSSKERYSFFKLLKTKSLLKFSVFFASIMFVIMMFRPFVPQFIADVHHYRDFEIGILGSISFFSSAFLGIILGKIADKWKKAYSIATSMILCSISIAIILLFNEFSILIIAFFITGGSYLTWSLMGAIVGPLAPEPIRARWISIPQTVSMFSSIIAPYIGGALYDISPYYPFIIAASVTLLLGLLSLTRILDQ